jgi:hypothetical protein
LIGKVVGEGHGNVDDRNLHDLFDGMAHKYFVLHAVCSACRFGVSGNFNYFFWMNGNFILFFLGEREFWKKINK